MIAHPGRVGAKTLITAGLLIATTGLALMLAHTRSYDLDIRLHVTEAPVAVTGLGGYLCCYGLWFQVGSARNLAIVLLAVVSAALILDGLYPPDSSPRARTSSGGDLYSYGEPDALGGTSFTPTIPFPQPSSLSRGGSYSEPTSGE